MNDKRGGFAISPCECVVLSLLCKHSIGLQPMEMFAMLNMQRGTLSTSIQRLRQAGLIQEFLFKPENTGGVRVRSHRRYVIVDEGRKARRLFAKQLGFVGVR